MTTTTAASDPVTRPLVAGVLALGPVATVVALLVAHSSQAGQAGTLLGAAPMSTYLTVALLAWSPLPFSVPAVLMDSARDAALPGFSGSGRLVRGLALVPYMVFRGPARTEMAASLLGFLAAAAVAAPLLS
jgi:hypothetical protein